MQRESPYLGEEELEVNDPSMPESIQKSGDNSSSGGVRALSMLLFFFGSGGNCFFPFTAAAKFSYLVGNSLAEGRKCLLQFATASSLVRDVQAEESCEAEERFDCIFGCNSTGGGPPFTIPFHGKGVEERKTRGGGVSLPFI
uniref:WD repeat-containing protein 44 n=1 Tax=Rhizophora mucronata TaxID=61149 RepID=A0A2P2PK33_RHIMU